jgi:hypothetical protein
MQRSAWGGWVEFAGWPMIIVWGDRQIPIKAVTIQAI